MKRLLLILFFILLLPQAVFAIDETADESIVVPFDSNNIEREKDLLEGEHEIILQEGDILEEKISPYSKEALRGIIEKNYDTNSTQGLFSNQLRAEFKKGPIKDVQFVGDFIFTFGETIDKDDNDFKFDNKVINFGLKGKFRSEKEGYNLLFSGTPAHQNFFHRFVLDAWLETKRIPNNTLMFGTSRLPVGYEGGQSAFLIPFLARSQTARTFGNSRKTGIRLKGNYKWADYDIGGYSSDTYYSEFFPGVESDIWVNFKPLANTEGKYGNLNLSGGLQAGNRNSVDFTVASAHIGYDYKNFWMRAEYANADGYNGGYGLSSDKAWGYNVTLAYKITKKLEFLLRYDDFDPNKKISNNNKKEYTAGINYFIFGQATRIMLNYVYAKNPVAQDSHKIILGTQFLL